LIQENTKEHERLATKDDLAAVRGELDRLIQENAREHKNLATKDDLAAVKNLIQENTKEHERLATKEGLAAIKSEISDLRGEMRGINRLLGFAVSLSLALLALYGAIAVKLFFFTP
ncbi:MAG: hypothetical protein ACUVXI_07920, partial [bacterium]